MKEQGRLHWSEMDGRDVDRLIDDALRAIARPEDVDLRRSLLERIRHRGERERQPLPAMVRPRLAMAAVVALATVVTATVWLWPQPTDRSEPVQVARASRPADQTAHADTVPPTFRSEAAPAVPASAVGAARAITRPGGGDPMRHLFGDKKRSWPAPAAPEGEVVQLFPLDPLADASEPVLPGAPAGDLGDGVKPMAALRPIAIAPIVTAPSVSDMARPVSDLTATDIPAETNTSGSSGGKK